MERSELKLKNSFWSAWSPPINWLLRTAATHEDLAFKLGYSDESMDFSGTGLVIGSKIVSSAEGAFGRYHGTMYEEEWEEDTDEIVYGDEIVIDEAEWKRRENLSMPARTASPSVARTTPPCSKAALCGWRRRTRGVRMMVLLVNKPAMLL